MLSRHTINMQSTNATTPEAPVITGRNRVSMLASWDKTQYPSALFINGLQGSVNGDHWTDISGATLTHASTAQLMRDVDIQGYRFIRMRNQLGLAANDPKAVITLYQYTKIPVT